MLYPVPSILVVEPHHDTCRLIHTVLSHAGYRVATTNTQADGLAALHLARPDLLVTAARLPGAPLFSLVDQIRAQRHTRRLPVLLCTTAVFEARVRYEALDDPFIAVISKPFDIDELVETAGALLGSAPRPLLRHTTPALV